MEFKLIFGVLLNQLLAADRSEIKFVPVLVNMGLIKLPDQLDKYDAIFDSSVIEVEFDKVKGGELVLNEFIPHAVTESFSI